MSIARGPIEAAVATYLARHPDEHARLQPLRNALAAEADPTSHRTLTGHVTCGAVVLDRDGRVLHVHHRVLNRYLLPGGHIEESDTNLVGAALRELHEEAGLPATAVEPLPHLAGVPLDIDVHPIPANAAKGEPAHQHFDFRFAFVASAKHEVRVQDAEVTGYRWISRQQMPQLGVAAKLNALMPSAPSAQQ
ncbi:NUDIX hydrolase [Actinacidiphila bryophytorum]|uniref:Adenosylhomocysteinase n=1 Tax=Actinacidiphila bryophytorum TaxID=1436133 RepID=A0A9W4MIL1_9ACTN|nr:NUDIX domain-containing protein [Actinacidiphila bryophytorum]MBM9437255.1 NUDIX domain-containing protein [Actinacidiphila bryophytorum]MBN6541775.1 NUDIX domain-containing protein [Actinacidiphila bryophytorum]CAG7651286.1 Adenosylhomocysteinase [Actinacidiphila bryophytorum]